MRVSDHDRDRALLHGSLLRAELIVNRPLRGQIALDQPVEQSRCDHDENPTFDRAQADLQGLIVDRESEQLVRE